ncbi:MAG: HAMP domain-containing histidine kinase [Thermoanaerobaculaceae bacterium]|jgi:signal transduction histidine kinase|nr:HAMP domain-containing histidine kinase [Thermoanaerobaculaceae bacterium]
MKTPPLRLLLALPVVAALILGIALTWLAAVAARTLRERDDAVREGVLVRLGHDLEAELREAGPADAHAAVRSFLSAHADALIGVEVAGPQRVLVREGTVGAGAAERRATLGPAWRGAMGVEGMGHGPGRGPQALLRLQPSATLGTSGHLAPVIVAGALIAAVALAGFSLLGVAGLAQRQKLVAIQAERQRLEVLASAGAGLAHRIRNPLAGIKGTAQLLIEGATPPVEGRARRILEASERIEALLGRLLDFARPPLPDPAMVDLAALAERVAGRTAGRARLARVEPVSAWADPEHVESIVEELMANAHAFDPGGVIEVTVRHDGRLAVIEVADRGPGLALDAERAFDPYVTTRPEGTGLGLPIVRALARANGGDVTLTARSDGGCVARLAVPAQRP